MVAMRACATVVTTCVLVMACTVVRSKQQLGGGSTLHPPSMLHWPWDSASKPTPCSSSGSGKLHTKHRQPARRLLGGAAAVEPQLVAAGSSLPLASLNWLQQPPLGWQFWQLPAEATAGAGIDPVVGAASSAGSGSGGITSAAISQAVVAEVAAHLGLDLTPPASTVAKTAAIQVQSSGTQQSAAASVAAASSTATPETTVQAAAAAAVVPPAFNTAFPPTALPRAPAPWPGGCPTTKNVKRFGAVGNGRNDDQLALQAANANRALPFLYFPPGVYRLATSLVLNKPVIMGANTRFLLDSGVVLTLMKQPRRPPRTFDPMFTGQGAVRMAGDVRDVYPGWWSAVGKPDHECMQAAIDSCGSPFCTVLLSRPLQLKSAVKLPPRAGVSSTAAAVVRGDSAGTGEGLVVLPGTFSRPLSFTAIRSFRQFGLKLRAGVRNANIQAGHVSSNGDGIVFESMGSISVYNTTVSHVSVMQMNQNSLVFSSPPKATASFDGVTAKVNFIVTGGMMAPSLPSAGVLFRGATPTLSRTQVIVQAIDPAQWMRPTQFVAVATQTVAPVSNFVFRSDCWNGGFEKPGALVAGRFKQSFFSFNLAGSTGRVLEFSSDSSNLVLTRGEVQSAGSFYPMATTAGAPAQFNGGQPLQQQSAYMSLTAKDSWLPGQKRTFYFYSYFAFPAVPSARMSCVPFRSWNPGVHCLSISTAPTAASRYQVALTLVNLSKKAIPAGFYHRLGVQVQV